MSHLSCTFFDEDDLRLGEVVGDRRPLFCLRRLLLRGALGEDGGLGEPFFTGDVVLGTCLENLLEAFSFVALT